ncbi:NAD(P)/FAD-dependent oxidoreductase [Piscinibacter terrae]|uniref:NAD(P)/FAD-dependent oxidoreductase n=1 Tax=Piscinibacter terrae TaxID=2496871 RepID=UPI001386B2C5|nr:NAD(P)/FAD-dependent oxidoreductase [Albitalea terrae]
MIDIDDLIEDPKDGGLELLDCVVVGAGPAGLTAGLYLRRFHRNVRIVDAGASRALQISRSNNCPGFPSGVAGVQLLERMVRHLRQVDGFVLHDTVSHILRHPDDSFVVCLSHEKLWTRNVLLCTGVKDRQPDVAGVDALVSADLLRQCPVCDGYEFTGKHIGVIGNSLHGVKEAAFIRHFSANVSFIEIAAKTPCTRLDVAVHSAGLHRIPGVARHLAVDADHKAFVTMDDGSGHRFDVLYAALGADPRSQLGSALGASVDERGNLVTDAHSKTSVPHLYAAGDVVSALDQISVAVGHAAIAATAIHNDLSSA